MKEKRICENKKDNICKKEIQEEQDSSKDMKKNGKGEKITGNRLTAMVGVLIALALILSYLESLVPINVAIPGIKLGLANLVTIVALRRLGIKAAIIVSVGRILLSAILFGNMMVLLYSFAGATLSLLVMLVVQKVRFFTVTGVSICGALAHNFGQLVVAALVMENANIMYYLPVLVVAGAVAGTAIGILAGVVLKNIRI